MDEKKTYSVTGTVTIGTDEYRDLVEERVKFSEELSGKRSECWEKDSEIKRLKTEKDLMSKKLAEYNEFLNSSTEATALYKAFVAEKTLKEAHMI